MCKKYRVRPIRDGQDIMAVKGSSALSSLCGESACKIFLEA